MRVFRTLAGAVVEENGRYYSVDVASWDELLCSENFAARVRAATRGEAIEFEETKALAPIDGQEVWAAGVTYYRSRTARMDESKEAGGGSFYDRVYAAERPELFFKSMGWRVIASGGKVRVREDATWSVPEPELTLVISPRAELIGYTIGNDMSSRDIEGENPLYLPQAKVYDGSCALGPAILVAEQPLAKTTGIELEIVREGQTVFGGRTTLAELKREPMELIDYLCREMSFPRGAFLMTGTGIVPQDAFTLRHGDVVRIRIDEIGLLMNTVA